MAKRKRKAKYLMGSTSHLNDEFVELLTRWQQEESIIGGGWNAITLLRRRDDLLKKHHQAETKSIDEIAEEIWEERQEYWRSYIRGDL